MIYHCCQEKRRTQVSLHPTLNGIDYLEVLDRDAPFDSPSQRTLLLYLLKPVPADWSPDNVNIIGGERIRNPIVEWVAPANDLTAVSVTATEVNYFSNLSNSENILVIRTDSAGDYSDYCLQLQANTTSPPLPPTDFDPRLVELTFSFKVECHSDFDCDNKSPCKEAILKDPDINYLAKDYASFRQLILDRMNYLLPNWGKRNPADLGITLAELVAYLGDQLSYWQDAVATEAYLHTARNRISLRRHSLLVDYPISEGCNSRSWIHLNVTGGPFTLSTTDLEFLTHVEGLKQPDDNRIAPDSKEHIQAQQAGALAFELLKGTWLHEDHNVMAFYTWHDEQCCLPKGATHATLLSHYPDLQLKIDDNGGAQYLLFEEVIGPNSGIIEDANPAHRQVVRLTQVVLTTDPLSNTDITEIYWAEDDALTFPLCISSVFNDDTETMASITNVSIARGNIAVVDHGKTVTENIGIVPKPWLYYPEDKDTARCNTKKRQSIPPRFRPRLTQSPLSHGAPAPTNNSPASTTLVPAHNTIKPLITDIESNDGFIEQTWEVQADLLNSKEKDTHIVAEIDNKGIANLRFGDNINGSRPKAGTEFTVTYRMGNGIAGNVGAESITHIVSNDDRIVFVRNPLPAQGGKEPETMAQIRRRAPQAFRTQLRAVTPEDYAYFTAAQAGVQQAAANPRWTGSWYTQDITVDRDNALPIDAAFTTDLSRTIEQYRMAGHDIKISSPVFVSLQLDMQICVSRDFFRSHVEQALLEIFNSGSRNDGTLGLFHPDNFSFGETLYLSPFYAAARQVPGVSSVQITRFSRQNDTDTKSLLNGYMTLGKLEIPRLDNNLNFPEHGVLKLTLLGGK